MSQAAAVIPLPQLPSLLLSAYKQVVVFFFIPGSSNSFTTYSWRDWI